MTRRRTRFSLDNSRVYPTGQDVESAARVCLLNRGLPPHRADRAAAYLRACFERSCFPTDDPNDRAHGKVEGSGIPGVGGWLLPGAGVESARPRRYPRVCLIEVRVVLGRWRGPVRLVSIDTECEAIGDRAARLSAAGIQVGNVGSVTGAQQQRARGPKDESTLAYVESIASSRGKELRDLLRPVTKQKLSAQERSLLAQADKILAGAAKGRKGAGVHG